MDDKNEYQVVVPRVGPSQDAFAGDISSGGSQPVPGHQVSRGAFRGTPYNDVLGVAYKTTDTITLAAGASIVKTYTHNVGKPVYPLWFAAIVTSAGTTYTAITSAQVFVGLTNLNTVTVTYLDAASPGTGSTIYMSLNLVVLAT